MFRLLLILLFFSDFIYAIDLTPNGIYRATREACGKVGENDLSNLNADKLRAGYFPTQNYTDILNFIRHDAAKTTAIDLNFEKSKIAAYILSQDSFHSALFECYPNNERLRLFFVNSVYSAERAGKVVGIIGLLTVFKGAGKLVTLIKAWSKTATSLIKIADKSLWTLVGTSLLKSDSAISGNSRIKLNDIHDRALTESKHLEEMIDSIKKQIAEEEKKIMSCGQCAEMHILASNKEILSKLLKVAQTN